MGGEWELEGPERRRLRGGGEAWRGVGAVRVGPIDQTPTLLGRVVLREALRHPRAPSPRARGRVRSGEEGGGGGSRAGGGGRACAQIHSQVRSRIIAEGSSVPIYELIALILAHAAVAFNVLGGRVDQANAPKLCAAPSRAFVVRLWCTKRRAEMQAGARAKERESDAFGKEREPAVCLGSIGWLVLMKDSAEEIHEIGVRHRRLAWDGQEEMRVQRSPANGMPLGREQVGPLRPGANPRRAQRRRPLLARQPPLAAGPASTQAPEARARSSIEKSRRRKLYS